MRSLAVALAILFAVLAVPAGAEGSGGATPQPGPLDREVSRAVAAHFASPEGVTIRNLHKSLARNGHGYCGEVAATAGADFVPFHLILDADGSNSLLLLPPEGTADGGILRDDAARLLRNFGCLP